MYRVLSLVFIDLIGFYLSLYFAVLVRRNIHIGNVNVSSVTLGNYIHFWWMPIIFILFFAYAGLYYKRYSLWDEIGKIVKTVTLYIFAIFIFIALGKLSGEVSRLTLLILWVISIFVFSLFRYFGKKILFKLGIWKENVLIVGADDAGKIILKALKREKHLGYEVVGFLDDNKDNIKKRIEIGNRHFPVLGKIEEIENWANEYNISTVIVAIPALKGNELSNLVYSIQKTVNKVLLISDLKGISMLNAELYHLFMGELFLIKMKNNLKSKFGKFLKRLFDIVMSLIILILSSPLIVIMAFVVKLAFEGPVFFVQNRLGRNKKIFKCIKFRTMYINADEILADFLSKNTKAELEWAKYKKLKDFDPRVTKIGKFLRKTSLDELPQIFNVIKGEMSLVGPRPYLLKEINDSIKNYSDIISLISPGITGLWQVSGRNKLTFNSRLKLDSWYVLNWSLWLDIVILFKTIRVVLKKDGAY